MDAQKVNEICKLPRMYYLPAEQKNNNCLGLKQMMDEISNPDFYMVEIGCFSGISTMLFAEYCKMVIAIDPFLAYSELDKEKIETAEKMFMVNYEKYPNNLFHLKMDSITASKEPILNQHQLDMVYIDGSHKVEDVEKDILTWLPKIKKGGWITGHDIDIDVRLAVEKVLGKNYKTYSDSSWAMQIS